MTVTDNEDFAPHISETDLDPNQLVLIEGDDGSWEELTVAEVIARENDNDETTI